MHALLVVADKVREGGHALRQEYIDAARKAGADDRAIHDTVLVAAAFSMFNRYVDGLATEAPSDPAAYEATGKRLAEHGYSG